MGSSSHCPPTSLPLLHGGQGQKTQERGCSVLLTSGRHDFCPWPGGFPKCCIPWETPDHSLALHCVATQHKSVPVGLSHSPSDLIPIYSSLQIFAAGSLLSVTPSESVRPPSQFKFSAVRAIPGPYGWLLCPFPARQGEWAAFFSCSFLYPKVFFKVSFPLLK